MQTTHIQSELEFDFGPQCLPGTSSRKDLEEILGGKYNLPLEDVESVVDVGANIGAFLWFACQTWPMAHIQGWEPHPEAFQILLKNECHAHRKFGSNATIHNAGCSDVTETKTLYDGRWTWGESSLVKGPEQVTRQHLVHVKRLDHVLVKPPCIVKIDTEGWELPVLDGLGRLGPLVRGYILEIHSPADEMAIEKIMTQWGLRQVLRELLFAREDRVLAKWVRT